MIEEIKHFRVNWVDGMKISKDHFNDLQNYTQDIVKDATSILLKKDNYGLIPSHLSQSHEYSVIIDVHKNINISIQKLRALAPNGARVEISSKVPDIERNISIEHLAKEKIKEGFVVLTLNSNENAPFGDQNLEEVPPRQPYLNNAYLFSFVDKKNIENSGISPYQLPIAKINKVDDLWEVDENYIAPCLIVSADARLADFYNQTDTFLKKIERYTVKIIQKILIEEHSNPIAVIIHNLGSQLLNFLGTAITDVKSDKFNNTPKDIVNTIVTMARIMKNHIDTSSPENKELLFMYFGEWTDLNAGDYENLFINTINLEYQHFDMNPSIQVVHEFMATIDKLFSILTEVDYIGKKKDAGIFVNENIIKDRDGSASFLTD